MIKLPEVTLIALSGLNYQTKENIASIEKSCEGIEFGAVKYIQDGKIKSIDDWNRAVIYDLPKYVEKSHALFIHGDSWVVHPELWDDEWLNLDFIGSPWPEPRWDGEFKDTLGRVQRVGNSVSLRSKRLLDLVATQPMEYYHGNNNEDGHICIWLRDWLEQQGMKFATFEQALIFGREHILPENKYIKTFLFHEI
jgi:hypothetical protein